ncbi:kinase-like domain-containing protein [Mycena capillaripes]|nr:kinase-like domain-containing protein [Mycena capillaripes]
MLFSIEIGESGRPSCSFGDIWKGLVKHNYVAVKPMRVFQDEDVKAALKVPLIWRQLSHPNVLPFFGIYYLENRLCLVSPWMDRGHIVGFLKNPPWEVDRVALILDIAMGLEYLHGESVVHGDLKGANILMTPSGRACIADFGLASIVNVMTVQFTHSTAKNAQGTLRWQASEILCGIKSNHFGSDVYAFACVCYEARATGLQDYSPEQILSGKVPFYDLVDHAIVFAVAIRKSQPKQPIPWPATPVHSSLWELMQDCWNYDPVSRPTAAQIVPRLVVSPIEAQPTHLETDWDDTYSSRLRCSVRGSPLLPSAAELQRRILLLGYINHTLT